MQIVPTGGGNPAIVAAAGEVESYMKNRTWASIHPEMLKIGRSRYRELNLFSYLIAANILTFTGKPISW
jgi:hypothetical protein